MGLEHAYYPGLTSNVLTCVWLPEGLSFRQLATELKAGGFVVYNGKGVLTDRIFQIGHIGALRRRDTRDAMDRIEATLARHGSRSESVVPLLVQVEQPSRVVA
jgi:aspartate aminotransferase-like enzyme